MALVRVYNDNVYPYDEVFKGDKIHIPSKKFIEMDEFEAIQFRGTFKAPVLDADGNHTAAGFKMIRLEKITGEAPAAPKVDELQCLACKYKATTKEDFNEHVKTHSAQMLIDEEAEEAIKMKRKAKANS